MKRPVRVVMLALALLAIVPAIATARDTAKNANGSPKVIVFNGQGNDLDAYASTPPFTTQKVYTTREKNPKGFD
ncbi:MAG: hypothetical protein MUP97_06025, partial [Acidimicrobiia bacterium]|nr:hypothetical protein [Acidimicrobiia bacterium]